MDWFKLSVTDLTDTQSVLFVETDLDADWFDMHSGIDWFNIH
jgi:hypothetical protein